MPDRLYQIPSHPEFRNIGANSLQGLEFAKDTVIFGINGVGKTTISTLLGEHVDPESVNLPGCDRPIKAFAIFNRDWMESSVGELIRGRSANGIATIVLGEHNIEAHEALRDTRQSLVDTDGEISTLEQRAEDADRRVDQLVKRIQAAIKKEPKNTAVGLTSTKFKAPAVKKLLEGGLSDEDRIEVDQLVGLYELLTLDDIRVDPFESKQIRQAVPTSVFEEIRVGLPMPKQGLRRIKDWVRIARQEHRAGDACEFCGNTVTQKRLDELDEVIQEIATAYSDEVYQIEPSLRSQIDEAEKFVADVKRLVMEDPQNLEEWSALRDEAVSAIEQFGSELSKLLQSAKKRIDAPFEEFVESLNYPDVNELNESIRKFFTKHEECRVSARQLANRKKQALEGIKKHYAQVEYEEYKSATSELTNVAEELGLKREARNALEVEVAELQSKLTTSQPIAEEITKSLISILGDSSLKVRAGEAGRYTIYRENAPASFMSEGEKKMLALLYFIASLKSVDAPSTAETLVFLDDVGSELDESRMILLDSHISQSFARMEGERPPAIVYTTHNFYYFRHLVERIFSSRASDADRFRFYEVYKSYRSSGEIARPTSVRSWDRRVLNSPTEYFLSFGAVVMEALLLFEDDEFNPGDFNPSISVGNHCRKVLESFTEFKCPDGDTFGKRINAMIQGDPVINRGAISKMANAVSHSGRDTDSSHWSRETTRRLVVETLRFVSDNDHEHFENMVKRVTAGEDIRVCGPLGLDSVKAAIDYLVADPLQ